MIAFSGAGPEVFERGRKYLKDAGLSQITINDGMNTDILFILTGGSERSGMELLEGSDGVAILAGDFDNSFAAALEIKAWCDQQNIPALLFNIAEEDIAINLVAFSKAKKTIRLLNGMKLGMIGNPSAWLIASGVDHSTLKTVFGIRVVHYPWDQMPDYKNVEPDEQYLNNFGKKDVSGARIFSVINDLIDKESLGAITIECFPMVNQDGVTACLSLSMLNDLGIPAGCEADLTAITGMVIARGLTRSPSWMANVASIDPAKQSILLAHCTIATGLVDNFSITTHFETGKGTAIRGRFKGKRITMFRFSKSLNKVFIAAGEVVSRPTSENACRTQLEVKLAEKDQGLLMEQPLGNHHIIVPGDIQKELEYLCKLKGICILT